MRAKIKLNINWFFFLCLWIPNEIQFQFVYIRARGEKINVWFGSNERENLFFVIYWMVYQRRINFDFEGLIWKFWKKLDWFSKKNFGEIKNLMTKRQLHWIYWHYEIIEQRIFKNSLKFELNWKKLLPLLAIFWKFSAIFFWSKTELCLRNN